MSIRHNLLPALLLLTLAAGCGGQSERPGGIILVSIDTLRPDHLGCYGYDKPTSPEIDALCSESVVFDQATAHAPSTLPSHASMMTSLLPQHHTASWENRRALPAEVTTLAEVLAAQGFRTAAFTGGGQIDPSFGLSQGFESYEVLAADDFQAIVDGATNWLDSIDDEPFFLFLHTYQVHHPYDPEPEIFELFDTGYDGQLKNEISVDVIKTINRSDAEVPDAALRHIVSTYDAEIREVDDAFGRLRLELQARSLWDPTVIALTSDHGEEFGEHGFVGWHSHTLFDELLDVPLTIKFQGGENAGRRIAELVRSIDIAPTLLKATDLRVPEEFSGIDLTALWSGREVPPLVSISRLDRPDTAKVSAIRDERFKLIRLFSKRQKLFDLEDDPEELWDTWSNYPSDVKRLEAAYEDAVASRTVANATTVDPDDELVKELEALGYID